ncbi:hypothetical protein AD998_21820 [bacterium 336/3]|nr:hypothetical protein AD998_21820 [bacterium 336/3]
MIRYLFGVISLVIVISLLLFFTQKKDKPSIFIQPKNLEQKVESSVITDSLNINTTQNINVIEEKTPINITQHDNYKQSFSDPIKPENPEKENKPLVDSLKKIYRSELYFAAKGTNVDSIRYENWKQNYQLKQSLQSKESLRSGMESFAGGLIQAKWHERGPNNEAGDMREVDFLPSNESIYAISTVGHLWKGNLNGLNWTLLNDDIRFEPDELEVLPHNSGTRIFAIFGVGANDKKISYSDDEGQTWIMGTGFSFYDHWGSGRRLLSLSDHQTLYYLVHTWSASPWGELIQLYKTTNKGVSYTKVWESSTGYGLNDVDLWKPYDSDQMYLVDNKAQSFYKITHDFGTGGTNISIPISYSSQGVSTGKISISGRYNSLISDYELYINTNSDKKVYKTVDGATWTYLSTSPESVWRKAWLADPDYNNLYLGGFQLNKSINGGVWEEQYVQWWEYYKNTPTRKDSMHVDMMNLDYFKKSNGTPFILICNHSGIHVTYDQFATTKNLGLINLNVTTLYDQTTAFDGFVYGGAQDKGNFKYGGNSKADFNIFSTDNMSTGDGMLGVFFNSDQSFFAMIQNGDLYCYKDRNVPSSTSFNIPGTNKPGWINPMVATPDFTDNKAYVAGGNLTGGSGSYLIIAEANVTTGVISTSQFNYDFRANSNNGTAVIKAIGVSSSDYNRIYVSTQDATFFSSTNQGTSWTKQTSAGLPNTMIPWDIKTSNTNADKVFICGTGFSNSGVYQSDNGGITFTALSGSIPLATFYEVALSDDEQFLFAATSEGPYVYAFSTATWYNLFNAETPYVDFNSVDNIGSNIIRFGTYGRGIWDFELDNTPLPFELVYFKAKALERFQTQIEWVIANEIHVQSYVVEHSLNGKDFDAIDIVLAKRNSSSELYYSFIHTPKSNTNSNYYRLKMIHTNGKVNYSSIQSVNFEENKDIFKVYPNPVAQNDRIFVESYINEPFTISFYDIEGRLVLTQKMNESSQIIANFPKGTYIYRLYTTHIQSIGKIIVQ